jgi:hypothetical protein
VHIQAVRTHAGRGLTPYLTAAHRVVVVLGAVGQALVRRGCRGRRRVEGILHSGQSMPTYHTGTGTVDVRHCPRSGS